MRIVLFYHSLVSDWNHGNAHFLRGIATELVQRGHEVIIYEPADSWSCMQLLKDHGTGPLSEFRARYPLLSSRRYNQLDIAGALEGADLILVHEWSSLDLVREIGEKRPAQSVLLFHDTHHRAVTASKTMAQYDLSKYDGVLAYGKSLKEIYLRNRWARRAWIWHEGADTIQFRPLPKAKEQGDLVWIGNWGDEERSAELEEYLIRPVEELGLRATVFGVRYPQRAINRLAEAGINYCGWLPNYRVPEVFAQFKATIHVPRRPYATFLQGIPTIRPFEAMACKIPLVVANWCDSENLFTEGKDFLLARNGDEMRTHLESILGNPDLARRLAEHGFQTVCERHTCRHRVEELLAIHQQISAVYA